MATVKELQNFSQQVRRDILRMVHAVKSGHPGGSLGCNEFITVLYQEIFHYSTDFDMNGENEDLFFLSNVHISPVFYSVLAHSGFFPVEELAPFRKLNSRLQGQFDETIMDQPSQTIELPESFGTEPSEGEEE